MNTTRMLAVLVVLASVAGLRAQGTGFFITNDGYVLTCYHVVKDALRITVRVGAEPREAGLVKVDDVNDLALLKAPAAQAATVFIRAER